MTRFSSDQLAKQYLQNFLEPLGTVQRNFEVPGEPKFVDVYFLPNPNSPPSLQDLGLLSRIATTPCLLEPFRNAPSRREIKTCQLKLLWVQEDQCRKAEREKRQLLDSEQAHLWILATRIDQPTLDKVAAHPHPSWPTGIFFIPGDSQTGVVAINKLSVTPETLWLRLLGKGKTFEGAVTELLGLPTDDNRRSQALQLLINWRVSLQLKNPQDEEEREFMATLSQAYLEWEQQTEQRGIAIGEQRGAQREATALVLRQLNRQVGAVPTPLSSQIEALPLAQIEALSEDLLDFQSMADLQAWLKQPHP